MKIFELTDLPEYLRITDFDNFFSIYDIDGNIQYNLNETLYINVDESILKDFTLTTNMHWPLISYKIYGTTRLAWLLMKLNKVDAINVFKIRDAAETIKYIPIEYVQQNILQPINGV